LGANRFRLVLQILGETARDHICDDCVGTLAAEDNANGKAALRPAVIHPLALVGVQEGGAKWQHPHRDLRPCGLRAELRKAPGGSRCEGLEHQVASGGEQDAVGIAETLNDIPIGGANPYA